MSFEHLPREALLIKTRELNKAAKTYKEAFHKELETSCRLRIALQAMTGQHDLSAWLSDDPEPTEEFEPTKTHGGHKMPVESPLEHQKYFASDECQSKLKSGAFVIPSKSADISHRR